MCVELETYNCGGKLIILTDFRLPLGQKQEIIERYILALSRSGKNVKDLFSIREVKVDLTRSL